jgi:AAA domain
MPNVTLDQILSALGDYRKSGRSYRANCPAHGGTHFNLSIFEGERGDWLPSCHSRHCSTESIWRALGLWEEARGPKRSTSTGQKPKDKARTQAEAQALHAVRRLTVSHLEGLLYGPLPADHTEDLEPFGPWASLIETAWDVYAEHGGHEAVRAWLNSMKDELKAKTPSLLRELQARAKARKGPAQAAHKPQETFDTYTLAELATKEFPPRRWIVPHLIPEGVHLIAGKSGLGKSYWALDLGLAVANGQKAWGKIPVEQGDVLYLDLESDDQEMQLRVERLLDDGSAWPDAFHVRHEVPTLDQNLVTMVDGWLQDHPRAKLVVIDVLAKIRGPRKLHGDIYLQDYAVGEALKPLAFKYHVAIIVLHHANKLIKPDDPLDSISGSTGLIGPAVVKGIFARGREQVDAKLFVTGRCVQERWIAFKYHACIWTYLGPAEDFERPDERRQVIAILTAKYPTPVSRRDLTACLQKDPNAMGQLLLRMEQAEEIKRVSRGMYSLHVSSSISHNNNNIENIENIRNNVTKTPPPEFVTDPPPVTNAVTNVTPDEHKENGLFVSVVTDSTRAQRCVCGYDMHPSQKVCFECQRPRQAG